MWTWLTGLFTGDAAGKAVKGVVNGVGAAANNILDRFIPRKMSEAEKYGMVKDAMVHDIAQGRLEIEDVNKARDMWMTFMRTQPMPWIARLINSLFRPLAGYVAILYLTDQFWAQVLEQFIQEFTWKPIQRDPVVDALVATVIYFFFGLRQRSKEKGVVGVS